MNKLHIPPLDEQAAKAALEHQKILAKPPLALGKLEPVAIRIAGMTGNPAPRLKDKAIVLFAADHHIADHGLSLTSTDVTYIQTRNFLQGGGTINAFTRNAGARLSVVDVGVNYDFGDLPGLVKRKVMHGANDFSRGPAMTREQALKCLQVGIDMAREEKNKGLDIVAAGEMGIGNTTPSSAIVAVLTGTPVETVTGRGSGVRGEVIRKKIKLIEQGIARARQYRHRADRRVKVAAHLHAKFGVWQRVGHTTGEITQCDRLLQPADTAQSDRMFGFRIFDGYQRTLFDQAERVGGGHADSSVGGIGIGVPNPQRATGEVELPDDLTTES